MLIVDAHTHIYPEKIAVKASRSVSDFYDLRVLYDGTVQTLLSVGERAGIDKQVIHSVATLPGQVESINAFIAATANEYPERFVGFATLHPNCNDIEKQVDRAISMGLKGIKLHPDFQEFFLDSPSAMAMYEHIQGRLPLLIHTGDYRTEYSKPSRLLSVLRAFPAMDVIAAHLGGWSEWGDSARELAAEGLFVDTCSSLAFMTPERARELINIFGVDHVFFGSDYPMWDAGEELTLLRKALCVEEDLQKVLGLNFAQFMEKYGGI